MNKFADRIKALRIEKKLTLKQLSTDLSLPLNTYANYEHGTREPPLDFIIALCDYYKVTADYLLGRTDN